MNKKDAFSEKYFQIFERIFNFKKKVKITEIDLKKPWFKMFLPYWMPLLSTLVVESFAWVSFTYAPVLIAQIFEPVSSDGFVSINSFTVLFIFVWITGFLNIYIYIKSLASLKYSLIYSAYKYFLISDPINHVNRSTGQMISKISKAVYETEHLMDIISFEILPFVIQIIVIGVTFFNIDKTLGLISLGFLVAILLITWVSQIFVARVSIPQDIKHENLIAGASVDSLQQIFLVRSSFATTEQLTKLKKLTKRGGEAIAAVWLSFVCTQNFPRFLFIASCYWLLTRLGFLVTQDVITTTTAISLSVIYFGTFGFIVNSGRKLEKMMTSRKKIIDLYDLAKDFGEQSYPVID